MPSLILSQKGIRPALDRTRTTPQIIWGRVASQSAKKINARIKELLIMRFGDQKCAERNGPSEKDSNTTMMIPIAQIDLLQSQLSAPWCMTTNGQFCFEHPVLQIGRRWISCAHDEQRLILTRPKVRALLNSSCS